jgi:hypothetical protein
MPNDSWFHFTTSNSYLIIKFVAATYPPAYFVTVIQPDIGLKNLFKNAHKMLYDSFCEGANVLYRLIQSDIDLKVHIAKHTDSEAIILRRSILSRASGISEILTRYLLPQEIDNEILLTS